MADFLHNTFGDDWFGATKLAGSQCQLSLSLTVEGRILDHRANENPHAIRDLGRFDDCSSLVLLLDLRYS